MSPGPNVVFQGRWKKGGRLEMNRQPCCSMFARTYCYGRMEAAWSHTLPLHWKGLSERLLELQA